MKETFFRTMTWLHTWVGLLVCWVLLLVFFAGTMSYYRYEISLWTQPELHHEVFQSYQDSHLSQQLVQGQRYLEQHAADAKDWRINFPIERKPYLSYSWQTQPKPGQRRGEFIEHVIKNNDQGVITEVRDSRGGNFFYRLHFDLHYMPANIARWIVGLCTLFMLLALISGIVIHKRIFKDFFNFRRNKGSRSWLDAHNISSVLALPYHLMITYTGLITLMLMYMPWGVLTAYDGDVRAFRAELKPAREQVKSIGISADMIQINTLLPQVKSYWGEAPIKQVVITNLNDENSRISFYKNTQQTVTDKRISLVFSGVTGKLVGDIPDSPSATHVTHDTLMSLHTARFAEPLLRGFFFICGIMGCAMIATGTLLWAVKIRQKQQKNITGGAKPSLGLRLVEGLNLTFIAGLPLATCSFFYANRLLPTEMANRAQWEANGFFITLALVAVLASINRTQTSWRFVLRLGSIGLIAIPVLNALTSSSHLISNISQLQWVLVGFDMMCVLLGSALWFASNKLANKISLSKTSSGIKQETKTEIPVGQAAQQHTQLTPTKGA
ncbi:PepSY domain-containing protein [Shewanella sp. D64]|uniref:PepSY-associated TM helix domain-containing protein n=1 Tax=unclassified Shewanella TaxID=196818 RepID=UPI0022BA3E74|nr:MULTISPECIES: PepSY-associated TM helix domain-containing protein [unclassified Shewanella]MEC4727024.1 PepSY domain-containing protein [Shewanella sp. D64]MEC4737763.1 PepSY domain-containing protein [Shewanella sp. E94]WBJ93977.1 PepSY domain-containing protein [Shewanella sp. MTB7]